VRDDVSWTTRKQSARCSRQITTPTPHHSIFTGQTLFLMCNQQCQSTEGQYHSQYLQLFPLSLINQKTSIHSASDELFNTTTNCSNSSFSATHTPRLRALFPGPPGLAGTRKVKPIWILLKQDTVSGSGISWAIRKSAPHSRQITTPAPHHSVFFTGRMPFLPPNQQRQSACENCEKNGGNECMRIFVLVQTPDAPPVNALKETLSNGRYQRKSPVNLVLSRSTN